MIGIYDDAGDRLAMGYRSLTINDDSYPVAIAVLNPQYDAVMEPRSGTHGMEAYEPYTMVSMLRLEGTVEGMSIADLHDKIDALNTAFDPVLSAEADRVDSLPDRPINPGYMPFTFSVPTASSDHPSGLMEMQYFARSVRIPVPRVSKFEGHTARFTIELQCADPRRYFQDQDSQALASGDNTVGNPLASYPSWPILTLVMTGAGSSSWSINRESDIFDALTLDLSERANGETVVIDMERRTIHVDEVLDMSLWVEGGYFELGPGDNELVVSSMSGVSSATLSWLPARV